MKALLRLATISSVCFTANLSFGMELERTLSFEFDSPTEIEEWGSNKVFLAHGHEIEDGVLLFEDPGDEMIWTSDEEDAGLYRRDEISGEDVTIVLVTATRGKVIRAEPIANKYAQGLVHHVGYLEDLEDEQTTWIGRGPKKTTRSPNRIDGVVWLLTDLLFEQLGGDAEFVDL